MAYFTDESNNIHCNRPNTEELGGITRIAVSDSGEGLVPTVHSLPPIEFAEPEIEETPLHPIFKPRSKLDQAKLVYEGDPGYEDADPEYKRPRWMRSRASLFMFGTTYRELKEDLQDLFTIEEHPEHLLSFNPTPKNKSSEREPKPLQGLTEELCHRMALEVDGFSDYLEVLEDLGLAQRVPREALEEHFLGTVEVAKARAHLIRKELLADDAKDLGQTIRGCDVGSYMDVVGYDPSEEGNAALIVDVLGKDLRYVADVGRFIKWNGSYWSWVLDETAILKAGQLTEWWAPAVNLDGDPKARKVYSSWYNSCGRLTTIRNSIALIKQHEELRVSHADLDNRPHLLNFKNGTLDLENWKFREPRREDLLTRQAPEVYDPQATCPVYDAFVSSIMMDDQGTVECVHRNLGATLTGMVKNPVLMMMVGSGSNGKTTFMNLMPKILGDLFSWVSSSLITARQGDAESASPMRLMLKGARGVGINESSHNDRLHDDELKRLVDTNPITARGLHESPVTFTPTHTLWMATNVCPKLDHVDMGVKRRIVVVNFGRTYRDPRCGDYDEELHLPIDPQLEDKLHAETSGILNRWLLGYADWRNRGHQVAPEGKSLEATNEYFSEEDRYEQFFEEVFVQGSESHYITTKECHEAFVRWVGDERYAGSPRNLTAAMKKSSEGGSLRKKGAKHVRRNHSRGFTGISLSGVPIALKRGSHTLN